MLLVKKIFLIFFLRNKACFVEKIVVFIMKCHFLYSNHCRNRSRYRCGLGGNFLVFE